MESYLTIKNPSEGLYKEKGSKFLSFAYPIASEKEVKDRLDELRKKHYDARHHCYAYIIGPDQKQYRANDDGEPHHSAGDPILGQIKSQTLTNTLIVVVRYFGGTKLGVSGLINAYKTAAAEALNNTKIIRIIITHPIRLEFGYGQTNEVMKLVDDTHIKIENQEFNERCIIQGQIQPGFKEKFLNQAVLVKGLTYDMITPKESF